MNDWRTMEAGPDLDRLIAEWLGWRMMSIDGDLRPRHVRHQLVNPDGVPVAYSNDEDGWKALSSFVPSYSTDLNAAWELLSVLRVNIDITIKNGPKGELLIRFWDKVWFGNYSGPAAIAICRAVLDWLDAKQAEVVKE